MTERMKVLVYGATQWEGEPVDVGGEDYRVVAVEPAPEVGYDGINQWSGRGGIYTHRAAWVTLERLSAEESEAWAATLRDAADAEWPAERPWWRFWS